MSLVPDMCATARDVASADDAAAVLERIVARAAAAVRSDVVLAHGRLVAAGPLEGERRDAFDFYAHQAAVVLDRQAADSELRRYERLVASFPGIVYLMELRADGDAPLPVYVSPQMEAMVGVSAQEWESDPSVVMRVVHPEDRGIVLENMEALREHRSRGPAEFRMLGRDGECRWMRPSGATFEEGGRMFVQGMLVDITEAKRAEAESERLEMELRLAQKLEAVGQLAAGIAHEINTPVQYVGDSVRFLAEAFGGVLELIGVYAALRDAAARAGVDGALLADVAEAEWDADLDYLRERVPAALQRAGDGVERVAAIVRAMRSFAAPSQAGKVPVDLNEALRNTLVVAASEYRLVADVECDLGPVPLVTGSLDELNQVFVNLIVNAAHAIAGVVGESGERGAIRIATAADDGHVVVRIADTGGGIPDDVAPRIFDPFFTTKDVGRGTGQGLALARSIVTDRHNGQISFDTTPGAGTTFEIRLPIAA